MNPNTNLRKVSMFDDVALILLGVLFFLLFFLIFDSLTSCVAMDTPADHTAHAGTGLFTHTSYRINTHPTG